jgi:hypothetical protein
MQILPHQELCPGIGAELWQTGDQHSESCCIERVSATAPHKLPPVGPIMSKTNARRGPTEATTAPPPTPHCAPSVAKTESWLFGMSLPDRSGAPEGLVSLAQRIGKFGAEVGDLALAHCPKFTARAPKTSPFTYRKPYPDVTDAGDRIADADRSLIGSGDGGGTGAAR